MSQQIYNLGEIGLNFQYSDRSCLVHTISCKAFSLLHFLNRLSLCLLYLSLLMTFGVNIAIHGLLSDFDNLFKSVFFLLFSLLPINTVWWQFLIHLTHFNLRVVLVFVSQITSTPLVHTERETERHHNDYYIRW